jgi:hypothetical protein
MYESGSQYGKYSATQRAVRTCNSVQFEVLVDLLIDGDNFVYSDWSIINFTTNFEVGFGFLRNTIFVYVLLLYFLLYFLNHARHCVTDTNPTL